MTAVERRYLLLEMQQDHANQRRRIRRSLELFHTRTEMPQGLVLDVVGQGHGGREGMSVVEGLPASIPRNVQEQI